MWGGEYLWVWMSACTWTWVYMCGCVDTRTCVGVWGGDREILFSISEETWTEVGGRRGNKKSGVMENKGQRGGEG